jgi:hypothetical protein
VDPQQLAILLAGQRDPFFLATVPRPVSTLNIPGLGPQGSALAQLMIEPLLRQYLPPGVFAPGQSFSNINLLSQARLRQDLTQMNLSLQAGTELDRRYLFEWMRGYAGTAGLPFNPAFAEQATRDLQPLMAAWAQISPGSYSAAFGGRDAATLANQVFLGGRFGADPVTGLPGLSPASRNVLVDTLYNRGYGPDADRLYARGLSTFQLGGIYNQLATQRLGPVEMSQSDMLRSLAREDAPGAGGFDRALEQLERQAANRDPALQGRLRQFNARRVADHIGNLTEAFSQVADLLAELGHQNADPAELLGVLSGLTQGQTHRLSPERLAALSGEAMMAARRLHGGPEGVFSFLRLAGVARGYTDALGLPGDAATRAALVGQSAADAYARTFGAGRSLTNEQAALAYTRRAAEGEASAGSLQLAAAISLAETFGDRLSQDPEGRAYLAAARAGRTHYVDASGNRVPVIDRDEGAWLARMQRLLPGVSASTIEGVRNNRHGLRGVIDRFGTGAVAFELQTELDMGPMLGQYALGGLRGVGGLGGDLEALIPRIAEDLGRARMGRLEGVAGNNIHNVGVISRVLGERYGVDSSRLTELVLAGLTSMDRSVAATGVSPNSFYESYQAGADRRGRAGNFVDQQYRRLFGRLSGFNRSSLMGRLLDVLGSGDANLDVRTAVGRIVGLPESDPLQEQLSGLSKEYRRRFQEYGAAAAAGDQAGVAAAEEQLERLLTEIQGTAGGSGLAAKRERQRTAQAVATDIGLGALGALPGGAPGVSARPPTPRPPQGGPGGAGAAAAGPGAGTLVVQGTLTIPGLGEGNINGTAVLPTDLPAA